MVGIWINSRSLETISLSFKVGECDENGTIRRESSGSCTCKNGFSGSACNECTSGYYKTKDSFCVGKYEITTCQIQEF